MSLKDNKKHVSFSEFSAWTKCPHYHKVVYVDGVEDFHDSEFTLFGKAVHSVLEKHIRTVDVLPPPQEFEQRFLEALKEFKAAGGSFDKQLVTDMREQGRKIVSSFGSVVKETFPGFEVLGTEELLYEPIAETDWFFKGFIDLILKVDGKIVIVDWKSCGWGWDARKRADKMINYQLTLYKHFYSKKHDIDPKDVRTFFGLLKRTAKKNLIEFFESTSGPKRTDNALIAVNEMLSAVDKGKSVKNRLNCGYCNFHSTDLCKRS